MTGKAEVERFTLNERLQHALLMLSTLILLVTGFSLLFHDVWIGRWLLWLEGGVAGRGLIHRWAAGVLMAACGYHFLYILFTDRGHAQFMHMRPRRQDLRDFLRVMRLNLGRPVERPAFDRFDYRQKFQYWAFFVAGASMVLSGLALWFATQAMAVMPKWAFDLLAVLHGGESVVIFLVLFLWHLYDVHLRPEVFPMDWSWITGRISLADLQARHPLEYERLRKAGCSMGSGKAVLGVLGAALLLLLLAGGAEAMPKCLVCHGKPTLSKTLPSGRVISLFVDEKQLKGSVHAGRTCTDCHSDITAIPHKGEIKRVSCVRCHFKGNPVGAPQTDIYVEYGKSVHGVAAAAGKTKAPVCQDCHGDHSIRRPRDPASQMNKAHIPETCGRCHLAVFSDFRESIHWKAFAGGKADSAVCTDCHGEHTIRPHESPESSTYISRVPETCSRCHASVTIVGKYGIRTEQVATYGRSFHGIAIKFGGKTVANCASCHGVHDIRPSDDPKSAVHMDNIPKTCGKCHTGANVNYAKGKIHVDPTKKEAGSVYWVSLFFKYLTISVMVGLVAHISLDLFRRFRRRGSAH